MPLYASTMEILAIMAKNHDCRLIMKPIGIVVQKMGKTEKVVAYQDIADARLPEVVLLEAINSMES